MSLRPERDCRTFRVRPNQGEPWKPLQLSMQQHELPGVLVTVDGIDGSGKSTLIAKIAAYVSGKGRRSLVTKTPSDDVRNMMLWRAWHDHTLGISREEIQEFGLTVISLGDKLLHQRRVVQKELSNATWVICDRYILSSLAFECGVVHQAIANLHIQPDLAIVVDVDPELSLERIRQRGGEVEHPDNARVALESRERLLALARQNRRDTFVVDTTHATPERTFDLCRPHIDRLLRRPLGKSGQPPSPEAAP